LPNRGQHKQRNTVDVTISSITTVAKGRSTSAPALIEEGHWQKAKARSGSRHQNGPQAENGAFIDSGLHSVTAFPALTDEGDQHQASQNMQRCIPR
jgi:hypothetical protein